MPVPAPSPDLTGVVVHWRDEGSLAELVAAWPRDPRFELVIVDNGSEGGLPPLPEGVAGRVVEAGENLGFAGGANRGVAEARAPIVLLLNPDARPEPGALDALLQGFRDHPEAAGLVPSLAGTERGTGQGAPQHRWQLKPLPGPARLVLEALFLPAASGPAEAPPAGTRIEQPAAAALALRRADWRAIGGMDEGFRPAWFEDVDLARRLRNAGRIFVYHPAARFRHGLGSTVPRLGFRAFLWLYYRNLVRYLGKHHGRGWAAAARVLLPVGMALRLALLPLRRPRRATDRAAAVRGLLAVAAGAVTGWRRPADLARDWARRWAREWPP
jgi:N-acetylglucosaminyl-diphospho-decaprenol L-rhamnosyltransferase